MKLSNSDIAGFLKAPPADCRGVLLYGPDGGLARERGDIISKTVVKDLSDPFNVIELTETQILEDEARLADELSSMSLMGGRRLVRLREAGDKSAPIIQSALAHAKGDSFLVVLAEELGPRSPLRALFEKEESIAALPCYRDEGRSLEALIRSTLSAQGIAFDADVLHYLSDHLGSDRGITMNELEKISLYLGSGANKRLTLPVVAELVGYSDDLSMDDLAQAVADGNLASLDDALSRLLLEGAQPVALIRAMARHFQRLYNICGMVEAGKTVDAAIASLQPKVFYRDVPVLKRQAARWTRQKIIAAQNALLSCEREVKSGSLAPELICSHALMEIALSAA